MAALASRIENNYTNKFPTELATKAAQAFVATAAIAVFCGSALQAGLIAGAVAATASVVDAVTRPIIDGIFPQNPLIGRFIQTFCLLNAFEPAATALAAHVGKKLVQNRSFLGVLLWISLNSGSGREARAVVLF